MPNRGLAHGKVAKAAEVARPLLICLPLLSSYACAARQAQVPSNTPQAAVTREARKTAKENLTCRLEGSTLHNTSNDLFSYEAVIGMRDGENVKRTVCIGKSSYIVTDRRMIFITFSDMPVSSTAGPLPPGNMEISMNMVEPFDRGVVAMAFCEKEAFVLTADGWAIMLPADSPGEFKNYKLPSGLEVVTAECKSDRLFITTASGNIWTGPFNGEPAFRSLNDRKQQGYNK